MSDAQQTPPPAPPAASITPLDQLVADAVSRGVAAATVDGDVPPRIQLARVVIDAVAQHIRDANLRTALPLDPLDPRLEAAIDDYMSGPAEPTADDTITARVTPDGYADIRHAGGR